REDGSFSPLDLPRPVPPRHVPVVTLEGGTIDFEGRGPLGDVLREVLSDDLEWRIENEGIATFPAPAPSPMLVGFTGVFGLPDVARVDVSGGYGRDESFHLTARVDPIDLGATSFRAALRPALREWIERHAPAGTLSLEVTLDTPPGAELDIDVSDVRATLSMDEVLVRHALFDRPVGRASANLVFDGENLLLPRLDLVDGETRFLVHGEVRDVFGRREWRVLADTQRLPTEGSLVSALSDPMLKRIVGDFAPDGVVALHLEVEGSSEAPSTARWRVEAGDAGPLSGSYVGHPSTRRPGRMVGFPYRLDDLDGTVSGAGPRVEIRSVTGTHNGGGRARVDGWVDTSTDPETLEIRVRADGVPIDDELIDALDHTAPGAREIVERFSPEAIVDVDVTVAEHEGDPDTHVSGRVRTSGGKMTLRDFPVPLTDVDGMVEIERDVYRVVRFTGRHRDASVSVEGEVDASDPDAIGLDLRISARDVRADDAEIWAALRAVVEERGGEFPSFLDRMRPRGSLDVDVELKQTPDGETRFRALVFPRDVDLVPSWFPIPIEGVFGRIVFGNLRPDDPGDDRFHVFLEHLEARHGAARVTAHGQVGEGLEESITVTGQDVRLSAALLDEVAGAIAAAAESASGRSVARVLGGLDAEGRVSFRYHHEPASGDRLDLDLNGVDCRAEILPDGGLTDVVGRVAVDLANDRLDASRLRGALLDGLAEVRSDALVVRLDADRIRASGDVDLGVLPFDAGILPLVPAAYRAFLSSRRPAGSIRLALDEVDVELLVADDEGPRVGELALHGTIRFDGCRFEIPVLFTGFDGRLDFRANGNLRQPGGFSLRGSFQDLRLETFGLSFEELAAALAIDGEALELTEVSGRLAGGRLPAHGNHLRVETGAGGRLAGAVRVEDADLRRLLGEMTPGSPDVSGRVLADFAFHAPAERISALEGAGEVRLTDGRLWDLPVFAALYRFSLGLFVGEDDRPTFRTGEIDFRVAQGMLLLDRFELKAPVTLAPVGMTVHGKGVIGPTGVDLRVVPQVIAWQLPLLSPAIDLLKRGLLNYRIYGPLANPRVAYWNAAADVMAPSLDVTRLPRLAPRRTPDWGARF
ncbi:MAG: AsmA-like C-terminal region-containing protein, partial [Planctomycetota bacterium JB042]